MNTYDINRIRHDEPILPDVPFSAYEVLQRVSGTGTVTKYKSGEVSGDTGKYGSLDVIDSIYFNVTNMIKPNFASPYDIALANAIYQMNLQADKLDADAIIFVRSATQSHTEKGSQTISVKISGTAVKIKK